MGGVGNRRVAAGCCCCEMVLLVRIVVVVIVISRRDMFGSAIGATDAMGTGRTTTWGRIEKDRCGGKGRVIIIIMLLVEHDVRRVAPVPVLIIVISLHEK